MALYPPQLSRATSESASLLVTETTYNARGLVDTTADPAGQVTRFFYDAMDRRILVVENYDSTNPVIFHWESPLQAPGSSGPPILRWVIDDGLDAAHPDRNRATGFVYDGLNNTIRQAAYVFNGAGNVVMQETAYIYEVMPVTGGSTIYSNDLLSEVIYPDSSTGGGAGIPGGGITEPQPIRFAYNHQGELIVLRDENDTKHEYTRDALGRVTLDKATVATNISAFQVDGTINAITTAFDTLGRVDVTRSYTNYGAGGQAVKNAVQLTYNDLWQVADVKQQPDGDINANSKSVAYTYETEPVASGNYSRQRILGYPDGWTLTYDFGTSGSTNDLITRPLKLLGPGLPTADTYAKYDYVGLSTVAIVDYGKPDVQLSRFVAHNGERTTGSYPGFDRFGRVIRHLWADGEFDEHATSPAVPNIPPIVEIAYTYDNASNRTGAFDARPGSAQPLSHQYSYDGLHRLKEAKRGVWNHDLQTPSVTHGLKSQNWSLDPLGNWLATNIETNGTSGFQGDEEETRDHNDAMSGQNGVNQLFKRHDPAWSTGDGLDLAYDFAGNLRLQELTDDGEFGAVGINSLVYTHDAWDRLVKVQYKDASGTLHPRAEYQYNGLNWRTIKRADTNLTDGTHALTQQRLMYYSAAWQLLEERIDDNWTAQSSTIDRHVQYVWGIRYIDDIIAHRQDDDPPQADGYEKVWFHLTDAQFSTVAVIDANANVIERVTYSAYGRARHHWFEDVDGDGDHDTADLNLVGSLAGKRIQDTGYRAEADLDRDGVIGRADYRLANSSDPWGIGFGHAALAEGMLSSAAVDNVIGWDGYVFNPEVETYTVRWRTYSPPLGRWMQKDPLNYIEGMSLYEYVRSRSLRAIDPTGRQSESPWLDQVERACRGTIDRPIDLLSVFNLAAMQQYQRLSQKDQGLIWVFVHTQACIMDAIRSCATCKAEEEWLINTSRDFMRPFAESLRERADGCPISDAGWGAFFKWLDRGTVNVPWIPDDILGTLNKDLLGYAQRLEIARRMALNHINSDLRNALMKHGVGRPGLWKCIGTKVDECQRKVVGGIAVGGDLIARFFDEFDVQKIRDKMREEVLDELTNQRILKCCNET